MEFERQLHPSSPRPRRSLTQFLGMRKTQAVCHRYTCSGQHPVVRPHRQCLWRPHTSSDPKIKQMGNWLFSRHPFFPLSPLEYNFILLVVKVYHTF